MGRIIIDEPNETSHASTNHAVLNNNVISGAFFESFLQSRKSILQDDGTVVKKGLSEEGIKELRAKSFEILKHCNPHNATKNTETTHLVVGYVQSGKTLSFTALTALAKDNGYRIVIYLAGTKTNLLNQTAKRLNDDLIDIDSNRRSAILISDPGKNDIQQIINSLQSNRNPIILMPILKHYIHINNVTEIFKDNRLRNFMDKETVIVIDDEADQTSLNSFGRKNSGSDDLEKQSTTYGAILRLRAQLPGNSYIQYTATPQANLLISMCDLLSPSSHTLLNPGEGYIGGKLFFGQGQDNNLFNGQLVMTIPQDEVYHKKYNPLKNMPKSLEFALKLHVLAVAVVVEWKKTKGVNYLSMMVHPDNTKSVNKKFKNWIDSKLTQWSRLLSKEDGYDDKEILLKDFEKIYKEEAVKLYNDGECPSFDEIRPLIREVLFSYKTYLVNTDKDANTEIDWKQYDMHILVGAEMLNRGFTVEKLTTTYMPRYSVGKANADTIEQRCRFFGYKEDYIKSCRVFLPEESIINYLEYIQHEEELRKCLAESPTLEVAERSIMLSPRLNPTRSNVIPKDVVSTALCGMRGMSAFESRTLIEGNDRIVSTFLDKHKDDFNIEFKYNTADRTHKGFKMSVNDAIELLSSFRFGNETDASRKSYTIRYIKYLAESEKIDGVYFIQMAYGAVRTREFVYDTKRLKDGRGFFAGRSPEGENVYPGDAKIYGGEDTLTIQLHRFCLYGAVIDFPKEAYTLAVYYPQTLATAYSGSIKEFSEDD